MNTYHKIQTVYKRDPKTKYKTLLNGQFSLPEFEYLATNNWIFTEKVDGTNVRLCPTAKGMMIKGKTDRAELHPLLLTALEKIFNPIKSKIQPTFGTDNVCFYGEGYGPKIQSGGKYSKVQSFVLFDIKINGIWLERSSVEDIAKKCNLEIVPIIGSGTLYHMIYLAKKGIRSQWGDFLAEGIVARPECELINRVGDRIITKIKTKDFLNE